MHKWYDLPIFLIFFVSLFYSISISDWLNHKFGTWGSIGFFFALIVTFISLINSVMKFLQAREDQ